MATTFYLLRLFSNLRSQISMVNSNKMQPLRSMMLPSVPFEAHTSLESPPFRKPWNIRLTNQITNCITRERKRVQQTGSFSLGIRLKDAKQETMRILFHLLPCFSEVSNLAEILFTGNLVPEREKHLNALDLATLSCL